MKEMKIINSINEINKKALNYSNNNNSNDLLIAVYYFVLYLTGSFDKTKAILSKSPNWSEKFSSELIYAKTTTKPDTLYNLLLNEASVEPDFSHFLIRRKNSFVDFLNISLGQKYFTGREVALYSPINFNNLEVVN